MTLKQLQKYVRPATAEVDSTGAVEILTPKGKCFEHTLHVLVTDPAMCDYPTMGQLYQLAANDFDGYNLQDCADNCSCKEE